MALSILALMRLRRPVIEVGFSLGLQAINPSASALAGHPHRLHDMRHGLTLVADPLDQQEMAMERQASVAVRHEDVRVL